MRHGAILYYIDRTSQANNCAMSQAPSEHARQETGFWINLSAVKIKMRP